MCLNLTPTPKIASKGPIKVKKAPNRAELKIKKIGLYFQNPS